MNEINCIDDIVRIKTNYESNPHKPYYRGQSNCSWKLLASLSRLKTLNFSETEIRIIDSFRNELKNQNIELIQSHPTDNYLFGVEWNFLFQSQHLGIPTRLLDWSVSPETALFFAVNENPDRKGKLFILEFSNRVHYYHDNVREERLFDNDPTKFGSTILINQSFSASMDKEVLIGEKRREKQFGRFIFQPMRYIKTPFEETCITNPNFNLIEYSIPASAKPNIMEELNQQKINKESLALKPNDEISAILEKLKKQFQ